MLNRLRSRVGKYLIFWNAPDVSRRKILRNNQEFWVKKLQGNKDRDKFVACELRKMGWVVVRVWEHELKSPVKVVTKIKKAF